MATKSSSKIAQFWRSDWFAGVAIVVAVILLNLATDLIGSLERKFYDVASTSSARQPSDRVAIIAIDDQSVANIGRWPWPRDVHARLIDQLSEAKAKTIVHTAFFIEPQVDRGLNYIRKMKSLLANPRLQITTIAYDTGFKSLSQFNRVFKRVSGISPREYRLKLVGGAET